MKKTTQLMTLAAICALAFASCKKTYTCSCTATVNIFGYTAPANSSTTIKDTKKNAETACDNAEAELNRELAGYGSGTCTLSKK